MTTQLKELLELEELSEKVYRALCDSLSTAVPNPKAKEYRAQQSIFFQANLLIAERFLKSDKENKTLVIHCPSRDAMYEAAGAVAMAGTINELNGLKIMEISQGQKFRRKKDDKIYKVINIHDKENKRTYDLQGTRGEGILKKVKEEFLLDFNYYKPTDKTNNNGYNENTNEEWNQFITTYLGYTYNLEVSKTNNVIIGPIEEIIQTYNGTYPISYIERQCQHVQHQNQILRIFKDGDEAQEYVKHKSNKDVIKTQWGMAFGPKVIKNAKTILEISNNDWLEKGIIITDQWIDLTTKERNNLIIWPPYIVSKMRFNKNTKLTIVKLNMDDNLIKAYSEILNYTNKLDEDAKIAINSRKVLELTLRKITDTLEPDWINNKESINIEIHFQELQDWIKNQLTERDINYEEINRIKNELKTHIETFTNSWSSGRTKRQWLSIHNVKPKPIYLCSRQNEIKYQETEYYNIFCSPKTLLNFSHKKIILTGVYLGNIYRPGEFIRTLFASGMEIQVPCYDWEEKDIMQSIKSTINFEIEAYKRLNYQNIIIDIIDELDININTILKQSRKAIDTEIWENIKNDQPKHDETDEMDNREIKVQFTNNKTEYFSKGSELILLPENKRILASALQPTNKILFYKNQEKIIDLFSKNVNREQYERIKTAKNTWKKLLDELYWKCNSNYDKLQEHITRHNPNFVQSSTVKLWRATEFTWFPDLKNLEIICKTYSDTFNTENKYTQISRAEKEYCTISISLSKKVHEAVLKYLENKEKDVILQDLTDQELKSLWDEGTVQSIKKLN